MLQLHGRWLGQLRLVGLDLELMSIDPESPIHPFRLVLSTPSAASDRVLSTQRLVFAKHLQRRIDCWHPNRFDLVIDIFQSWQGEMITPRSPQTLVEHSSNTCHLNVETILPIETCVFPIIVSRTNGSTATKARPGLVVPRRGRPSIGASGSTFRPASESPLV